MNEAKKPTLTARLSGQLKRSGKWLGLFVAVVAAGVYFSIADGPVPRRRKHEHPVM